MTTRQDCKRRCLSNSFSPPPSSGEVPAWSLVPDGTASLRQAGLLLPPPSPPPGQNCPSQGGQGGGYKVQVQVKVLKKPQAF